MKRLISSSASVIYILHFISDSKFRLQQINPLVFFSFSFQFQWYFIRTFVDELTVDDKNLPPSRIF